MFTTTNSIFPQSDDRLFTYLLSEIPKHFFGFGDKRGKDESGDIALLLTLGFFAIVGTEPFKILLRKNIGKHALSIPRTISACIIYLLIGVAFFYLSVNYPDLATELRFSGLFYGVFSLFILILGIKENAKAKRKEVPDQARYNSNIDLYRGDSVLFNVARYSKEQERIWLVVEPLLCLAFSLLFSFIVGSNNHILYLLGLPLIITSVAFWMNESFQIKNIWNVRSNKIQNESAKYYRNQQSTMNDKFQSVKND